MTLKSDLKFDLPFCLKNCMGNLVNLIQAVESLKICTLMCYFCRAHVMLELIKYRGVVSSKNDLCFQINAFYIILAQEIFKKPGSFNPIT